MPIGARTLTKAMIGIFETTEELLDRKRVSALTCSVGLIVTGVSGSRMVGLYPSSGCRSTSERFSYGSVALIDVVKNGAERSLTIFAYKALFLNKDKAFIKMLFGSVRIDSKGRPVSLKVSMIKSCCPEADRVRPPKAFQKLLW